jgi:hypothetical protein
MSMSDAFIAELTQEATPHERCFRGCRKES